MSRNPELVATRFCVLLLALSACAAAAAQTTPPASPSLAPSALAPPSLSPPPLTPPPDVAFGAYQRGEYAVAMREAKKRAADNPKDTAALALIGRLYAEGAGVARDHKQAMDWFRRAAETGGAQGAYLYGAALLSDAPGPRSARRPRAEGGGGGGRSGRRARARRGGAWRADDGRRGAGGALWRWAR